MLPPCKNDLKCRILITVSNSSYFTSPWLTSDFLLFVFVSITAFEISPVKRFSLICITAIVYFEQLFLYDLHRFLSESPECLRVSPSLPEKPQTSFKPRGIKKSSITYNAYQGVPVFRTTEIYSWIFLIRISLIRIFLYIGTLCEVNVLKESL